VTVASTIVPDFTVVSTLCAGSVAPLLPATSTNGVKGTWAPPTVSNTASGTYTFSPDAGECASQATLDITVTTPVTPTFAPTGVLCQNTVPPTLATTSINGITGTWNPPSISTTVPGTYNFRFTPGTGQCASIVDLSITVDPKPTITFTPVPSQCLNSAVVNLSATPGGGTFSGNGVTGTTFDPATAGIGTHALTYLITSTGGCISEATITVSVLDSPKVLITNPAPLCNPNKADLTNPSIVAGSSSGLSFTYWMDAAATIPVSNPSAVGPGTYYIKGEVSGTCFDIQPVTVVENPPVSDPSPVTVSAGTEPVCQVINETTTTTYLSTATSGVLTYSVTPAGVGTMDPATGVLTWASGFSGTATIVATVTGCDGTRTAQHQVIVNPSAGTPVFAKGPYSNRVPANETLAYTATSANSTGLTYSLDAASLAGGNTINPATGEVTFVRSWNGISVITATATGCNGPKTATHQVSTDLVISDLYITADNKTKAYGDPLPPLTVSYSPAVSGADLPAKLPTVTTTATASSSVGTYPIDVSGAEDARYTMNYNPGTLMVTKVNLVIQADNKSKGIGAPLPQLTYTYAGLVNGDTKTGNTAGYQHHCNCGESGGYLSDYRK
jgi:hypothetical protein